MDSIRDPTQIQVRVRESEQDSFHFKNHPGLSFQFHCLHYLSLSSLRYFSIIPGYLHLFLLLFALIFAGLFACFYTRTRNSRYSTLTMTGSSYLLRPATPTEIESLRRLHVEMWAKGLDLDQYLARERTLQSATLTRDGGLQTWVLVDPSSSTPNEILSSCETIQKDVVISRPRRDGNKCAGGKSVIEEGKAHGIGSVFTPKGMRGRGYASVMLGLLSEMLERENGKGFSVLFSDIGKVSYKDHPAGVGLMIISPESSFLVSR